MGFSTNYDDVQDFDLIPKGEYEVIIKNIEEHTTQKGATGLNLTLIIRNDKEKTAVSADSIAPKKQEQFAGSAGFGSLDDFEEILGDGDVPF